MHLYNNTFSTTSCKNCVCVIKQILISNIKLTLDLERLDRLNDFLLVTLHARKRDLQIAFILSHKLFLRRAGRLARLLVITSVSDLWGICSLLLVCHPFLCLLPFIVNTDVISNLICPKWIKLDQTWSDLIELDQTWSKCISHQSKNVTVKSCHIYKKDENGRFIWDFFGSDLSKMDQTWSNWISHKSKNISIKSFHIHKKAKNACLILDFFGSDLSKMDQFWSNFIKLDFSPIKKLHYKKLPHLQKW